MTNQPYTDLETAKACDQIVREYYITCPNVQLDWHNEFCPCGGTGRIHPYAAGLGVWVEKHRGSEWPSMVWRKPFNLNGREGNWTLRHQVISLPEIMRECIFALTWLEAADLLEECKGWILGKTPGGKWSIAQYQRPDTCVFANDLPSLVRAIIALRKEQ